MGVIALVLLIAAAALLVATEWPRVGSRVGLDARRRRERQRRKSKLRVVPIERDEDSDEFARPSSATWPRCPRSTSATEALALLDGDARRRRDVFGRIAATSSMFFASW